MRVLIDDLFIDKHAIFRLMDSTIRLSHGSIVTLKTVREGIDIFETIGFLSMNTSMRYSMIKLSLLVSSRSILLRSVLNCLLLRLVAKLRVFLSQNIASFSISLIKSIRVLLSKTVSIR